jgi:hypothetical protein
LKYFGFNSKEVVVMDSRTLNVDAANAIDNILADWNSIKNHSDDVLHLLIYSKSLTSLEALLKADYDSNITNGHDETALHLASKLGETESVNILLQYGADLNAQDKNGYTALHNALEYGKADVIPILMCHGANPHILNAQGKSCVDISSEIKGKDQAHNVSSIIFERLMSTPFNNKDNTIIEKEKILRAKSLPKIKTSGKKLKKSESETKITENESKENEGHYPKILSPTKPVFKVSHSVKPLHETYEEYLCVTKKAMEKMRINENSDVTSKISTNRHQKSIDPMPLSGTKQDDNQPNLTVITKPLNDNELEYDSTMIDDSISFDKLSISLLSSILLFAKHELSSSTFYHNTPVAPCIWSVCKKAVAWKNKVIEDPTR